jgi:hypothetical protein
VPGKKNKDFALKMGVKGFHGFCKREVLNSHRTINILEELEKYKR